MLFSTSIFIYVFLPLVLIGYYIVLKKSRKLQNIFLTICSLFFYAWGEPIFVVIMLFSIFINWILAILVDKYREDKKKSKRIIVSTVIVNLSILFIFKYLMFTILNINNLFGINITVPSITLPIGISFFTFQAMSYVIDVYKKKGEVQKNILNVALYIAFFPQLIAGPIVRYETIADQIKNRKETWNDFTDGVTRFVIGLSKKVIISNNMALIADAAFAQPNISVGFAWLGAIAYTMQIFFDFSGYSDMAIGLGKMFGFKFLENFNYPYISKSISEFWRRWHISLGSWFRDYVYIPLGGSKVNTKFKLVRNLFVVWMLTGIWHGANWTFVIWGAMYFILITLEKITKFDIKLKWFGHIYTMFFVIIGWVIFRANDLGQAFTYLGSMFGIGSNTLFEVEVFKQISIAKIYLPLALICSFPLVKYIKSKMNAKVFEILYAIIILIIFIIAISFVVKGGYNPFIYFNF